MITVWIDELTPCLKNAETGAIINTEVVQIKRKSVLKNYNKKNGWYTNWAKLADDNDIYALLLEGTYDIQGLIAVEKGNERSSAFVTWMVAAPENNKLLCEKPKYIGVGGHLFAIAAQVSINKGFGGDISGFAANATLLKHYMDVFNAEELGILHKYHFAIFEKDALDILEVYDYEWTDDEI